MPLTVEELMQKMPGAFIPEKAQGLDAVIQFRFTGAEAGEWVASSRLGVYPCFVHKRLLMGRASGCGQHRRGHLFINSYIIPY